MVTVSKQLLQEALEKIKQVSVLVVGDIILDRYIWGIVERISPEAPVPVVHVTREEERLGGASNVVSNLCKLGVKAQLCGYIGNDTAAQRLIALLRAEGVESGDGLMTDAARPTCLKTRVIAQAQQMLRIDREDNSPRSKPLAEGLAALVAAHAPSFDAIILSDYGKGAVNRAVLERLMALQQRENALSSLIVVDPHPHNFPIYDVLHMDVIKPNRKEAEAASGMRIQDRTSAVEAARILLKKWNVDQVMVTLGEAGLLLLKAGDDTPTFLETRALRVFDVSGAGDTVTAVYTAARAAGISSAVAGELANISAGIVVSEIGTVAVTRDQLFEAIEAIFE